LRARRELTSIVLAIWLVTLKTSPWKVLRRSEEMEASPMCPDTTVMELMARLLTSCSRTVRRSPTRVLTFKELMEARSV
jgi:hypothetical protein